MATSDSTKMKFLLSFFRFRWLWSSALLTSVLLLVLVAIPYGIAYSLKHWLQNNGGEKVQLADVDFNPFAGVAVVKHLKVSVGDNRMLDIPELVLDIDWSPLFSRQIYVKTITLDGVHLEVEQGQDDVIRIGGVILPRNSGQEAAGKPWDFGISHLRIENSSIVYRSAELQLEAALHELVLSDLYSWAHQPATLQVNGTVNGADVSLDGSLPPLADGLGYTGSLRVSGTPLDSFAKIVQPALAALSGSLTIDCRINAALPPDGRLAANLEGLIRLDHLHLAQKNMRLNNERLQWNGHLRLAMPDKNADFGLSSDGTATGSGLVVNLPDAGVDLQQKGLAWHGAIELQAAAKNLTVSARGKLAGDQFAAQVPREGANLQQGRLVWEGDATYTTDVTGDLQVTGNLRLEKLLLNSDRGHIQLARLEQLDFDNLRMKGTEDITLEKLTVNGATFAQGTAKTQTTASPPLQAAGMQLDLIRFSAGNRLTIDRIESRDTHYSAIRNPGGKWRITLIRDVLPFTSSDKTTKTPSEQPAGGEQAGSLRIGSIHVTGDSTLSLVDHDVSPPFKMRLNLQELVSQEIDTARPDQASRIMLKGNISAHDQIEIQGTVRPFATPLKLDLQGVVEDLKLPPLSPYAITSIGHRLFSGQLDMDSRLRIDNGRLDGHAYLTMRGLKMTPVKGDALDKMQTQLAVPLDFALDMLRDKHNTIRLKLPIRGDLDNPDFDFSDAINQAVAKATKNGAMTYLTLALQPYGTLITVVKLAGDAASKVRLDPVVFEPASTAIDYERFEYLDKVAGILKNRPEVNIKLCGVAVESDRVAFRERAVGSDGKGTQSGSAPQAMPPISDDQLLLLANQRAAAVEEYLINRQDVNPGRLVACQPRMDADAAAKPRVDLLI